MQSNAWLDLLRLVPEKQHQNLVVMTSIGDEVAVQDIVRMEQEYLVLRGRLAGSNDLGRAFFVPYDHIVYLGYRKPIPQTELYGMYGATPPERTSEPQPAEEGDPKPEEQPAPGAASRGVHATPAQGVNRSELLQRIRARSKQAAGGGRPIP